MQAALQWELYDDGITVAWKWLMDTHGLVK